MQVSVRIHSKSEDPELFFYNSNPRVYWLECFGREGMHSEVSREYMLRQTRPARTEEEKARCSRLFNRWSALPGGNPADPPRMVARLTRPT